MVKKSFLGRLFGKKGEVDKSVSKKKPASPENSVTATATMTKKGKDSSPASRISEGALKNRFDGKGSGKGLGAERQGTVTADKKDDGKNKGKEKAGADGAKKAPIIEPEIQSKAGKAEMGTIENREKIDVIAKKMTAQEEASIKISDGIKGLSNVLSNIDQRLEEQTQQSTELARTVKIIPEVMKDIPESSRAGVELLQSISQILEKQSQSTAELGEKVAGLPQVLDSLSSKIDQDAADRVEDRAAIKEAFQESTASMNVSLEKLEERQEAIRKTNENLSKAHDNLSKMQVENTKEIVKTFRNVQEGSQAQVDRLIDKNRMTNRLMAIMILVILVGVVSYLVSLYTI